MCNSLLCHIIYTQCVDTAWHIDRACFECPLNSQTEMQTDYKCTGPMRPHNWKTNAINVLHFCVSLAQIRVISTNVWAPLGILRTFLGLPFSPNCFLCCCRRYFELHIRRRDMSFSPPNRKKKCHLPLISRKYLAFISIRPWGFSSNWLREGKKDQSACETNAEFNDVITAEFGDGRFPMQNTSITPFHFTHTHCQNSIASVYSFLLKHLSSSLFFLGDQNFWKEETEFQNGFCPIYLSRAAAYPKHCKG